MIARNQSGDVDAVGLPNGQLLRIEDISKQIRISKSMVWKLINGGEIHSYRIGRAVRVKQQDVDAYLAGALRE